MKKFALALSTIIIASITHAQTWTPFSVGSASEVMHMSFPTDDTGYVSMSNGTLRKTTNGALNWSPCNVMTTMESDVEFVSGMQGFMFANNGVVRTTDGAQTWNYVITNSNLLFYDICFATPSVGFVSATNNNQDTLFIYKTIDGGATWNLLPSVTGPFMPFFPLMYFVSASTGFVSAESYILRTTDGGITWTQEYYDQNGDIFCSMHSPDGVNIFAGFMLTTFASTPDAGDNWTPSSTVTSYPAYGVYFMNASQGFYCGGNGFGSGAIERTNNGGATWTSVYTGNTLWCMDFPSSTVGYAAGTNGVIVKYDGPTSVPENESALISCYPNPTSDFLNVGNIAVGSIVTVTNALGQIIFSGIALDNCMRVDVRDLLPGIYTIAVCDENRRSALNFVRD